MKPQEVKQYLELFSELSSVVVEDGKSFSFGSTLGVMDIEFDFKCDALLCKLHDPKVIYSAFGFNAEGEKDIFTLSGIQSFIINSIIGLKIRSLS